jgi:hypothetical protein
LAVLYKKYDDVIPSKKKEWSNGYWESGIYYTTQKLETSGASQKTDIEIITHIMNTALKAYFMITTKVKNMTHMGPNPIKKR